MKRFLLALGCLSLAACSIPGIGSIGTPSTIPGVSSVCTAINGQSFDTALKGYDVARAAVDSLIDFGVIKPGSPTAIKIADANDKVLSGFAAAEAARDACNATNYLAALNSAKAAIVEIKATLPKRN